MVLHVARDGRGARRLTEVGLLRRGDDGRVTVVPCWHIDRGYGCARADLDELLRSRGRR